MMLERGVVVSYETIRRWCAKFGQAYANHLRRRRPQPGHKLAVKPENEHKARELITKLRRQRRRSH